MGYPNFNIGILIFIYLTSIAILQVIIHGSSLLKKNSRKNSMLEPMLGGYINFNMSNKQTKINK
jgi:hypothetical protein